VKVPLVSGSVQVSNLAFDRDELVADLGSVGTK